MRYYVNLHFKEETELLRVNNTPKYEQLLSDKFGIETHADQLLIPWG